jgi:putative endopeptidase
MAPGFDWATYFLRAGAPATEALNVVELRYFETLARLWAETELPVLRAYLRWHYLHSVIGTLGKSFVDEDFSFYGVTLTGQAAPQARWYQCFLATTRALPDAIGHAYILSEFSESARTRAVAMITDIQATLGANLATLDWLDAPTRAAAIRKLVTLRSAVGYPDRWRDYSALPVDRRDYFTNRALGAELKLRAQLSDMGRPVDRGRSDVPVFTVDAGYSPSLNQNGFPAGILQPPFYGGEAPLAQNLGGIGVIMGHEFTHGFDDEGSRFDGSGNLRDWWSPAIRQRFNERAQCLVDQYDRYTTTDGTIHINGKLTLGENIADLGGMKLALGTYQAYREEHPGEPEAEVLGFNGVQQLFVGFAQVWCTKMTPAFEALRAATDPHAPPRHRVNGVVVNTPEFAAAFGCAPGQPMSPVNRCQVW